MILTGVDVVSAGPGIEISKAKAVCDLLDKGCICGNVDPIGTLLYGTRAQVRAETKRILDAGARSPGYIANSGEMIPRDVPEENIRAMIETIKEYKI
ncbi:Uroporphyrinogen decarboxylase [bioreactor metagenome]|uniref:Uroporphyrinogen decarboxylase n=1 Tax=bioreactor metagenome TaxID=1076179 RepID=A0A645ED91_9ZZZZ